MAGGPNQEPVPDLPGGTVTFLFTDIEGSTRRWQLHESEMRSCVTRHEELLRHVVSANGGTTVKGTGDGIMAVFAEATAALTAGVDAQRALGAEDWGPLPDLRVRMGLHTGSCHPTGADYFGSVVNRSARVADAGHGGQIIVSSAAAGVMEPLPEVTLVSRGYARLRDLAAPLELFQVEADGVDSQLLPLRTLDDAAGVFPTHLTTFLGREQELEAAAAALDSGRLVTLVGPGGVGKTRLSTQLAAEIHHRFEDGVSFVELAGATASTAQQSMLDQLALQGVSGAAGDPVDGIIRSLGQRETLVVIDNCEHVIDEVASTLHSILGACSGVRIVVTSREPLRIPGEYLVKVTPLSVNDENGVARRLFIDRADAAGVGVLATDSLDAIDRICELVDGLPLGIELAAAQLGHLSATDLATRLAEHPGVLVAHDRTVAERHRSIEDLLGWSHDLLTDDERRLLHRLSVVEGPVLLEAIEALFVDERLSREQLIAVIGSLVSQSLVRYDPETGRYELPNLIRSFAAERLSEGGETEHWTHRHAQWCAEQLEQATSSEVDDALAATMADVGVEITAAFRWTLDQPESDLAVRLGGTIWRWYEMNGRSAEGITLLRQVLARTPPPDQGAWAAAVEGAANLALATGDVAEAVALHEQALEIFRKSADVSGEAWAHNGLATALHLGGSPEAADHAAQALTMFEAAGDDRGAGHAHVSLGLIAARGERPEEAERHLLEALTRLRLARRRRDTASVLSNLGNLAQDRGDLRRADRYFDGALALHRELGDQRGAGLILNNLSLVAQRRGDPTRAAELAQDAYEEFSRVQDRQGQGATLHNLGNLEYQLGNPARSMGILSESLDAFRSAGDARGVVMTLENLSRVAWGSGALALGWKCDIDRITVMSRLGLDAGTRSALEAMSKRARSFGDDGAGDRLVQAIDRPDEVELEPLLEELRFQGPTDEPSAPHPDAMPLLDDSRIHLDELTTREIELLQLVGGGLSNSEIADELYISKRTVDSHLSHIRTKLGLSERSKLVVLARERLL